VRAIAERLRLRMAAAAQRVGGSMFNRRPLLPFLRATFGVGDDGLLRKGDIANDQIRPVLGHGYLDVRFRVCHVVPLLRRRWLSSEPCARGRGRGVNGRRSRGPSGVERGIPRAGRNALAQEDAPYPASIALFYDLLRNH